MWTLTHEEEFPLMHSLQGESPTHFWILSRVWGSCSCPAMASAWPTWEMSNGNHFWLLSKTAKNNKWLCQVTGRRTPLPEDTKTWKLWGQIKWLPQITSLLLPGNFHFQKQKSQGKHKTCCSGTSPHWKLTFLGVPEENGGKNKQAWDVSTRGQRQHNQNGIFIKKNT